MAEQGSGPWGAVTVIARDGRACELEAVQLVVDLGHGRCLRLGFPHDAWGDLDIEADSVDGTPMLGLKPSACNALTLRVDVLHDAVELPPAPVQSPTLALTVQRALPAAMRKRAPRKRDLRVWALAAMRCRDAEVTIRLVDEEEGRTLNRDYRGKDAPTNVLSFVYQDHDPADDPATRRISGDLVLCAPVVEREAKTQGRRLAAHYAHLVVHGMLHLQGFDHQDDGEAAVMEALESDILIGLGFTDPYA